MEERSADVIRVGVAWRELRRGASMGALRHRFRATSVGTLDLAQADALDHLVQSEGMRMGDFADVLRVDASTATRAVQRLVEAGLAERRADPADGRSVIVVATTHGRSVQEELVERRIRTLTELVGEFDDHDLDQLATLLERLIGSIDALAADERQSARS
jgi:DNA-binding MarR family transcriptional regulator